MKALLTTKVISIMFILCALSVFAGTAQAATLFSDGFESGNFTTGGWSERGYPYTEVRTDSAKNGTYGARLAIGGWIIKAQSTVGYSTIHVKYWRKTSGLGSPSTEYLFVEWSTDGTTWTELERTRDLSWVSKDYTCASGANNNAGFRIRFRINGGSTTDQAYIDDVEITGTPPGYTISGTVTSGGSGLDGVTMNGLPGNPVTSGGGLYTATVDSGWNGTVTPAKTGYTFAPADRTYTSVAEDHIGDNYAATLNTYTISGNTGVGEVTLGGLGVVSDGDGNYTKTVDYGWSGTVTPSKYAYAFEPNSRYYADVNEDATGQDYTGTLLTYRITGYIKNECDVPIEGVQVDANNGGGEDTTDADGYYEVWVDYNWSGTVTPGKAYYTFDPSNRAYTDVLEDKTDQGYIAANIYDLDCDGSIGCGDVGVMGNNWLDDTVGNICDFNEDIIVNFNDFAEFANVWLTEYTE